MISIKHVIRHSVIIISSATLHCLFTKSTRNDVIIANRENHRLLHEQLQDPQADRTRGIRKSLALLSTLGQQTIRC